MPDERVQAILHTLAETYPDAHCALDYRNAFELLIATILSAQCTDQRVNQVTKRLFARFPGPADIARLTPEQLEPYIQELGLYHNKARNIVAACRQIITEHNGAVPSAREDLEALPGVGRKTANVVLSNAFGVPAIAVDTHVFRVARRLNLAVGRNPRETEQMLCAVIPQDQWSKAHHWLIYHGRQVCFARKPACNSCPLLPYCPGRDEVCSCS